MAEPRSLSAKQVKLNEQRRSHVEFGLSDQSVKSAAQI